MRLRFFALSVGVVVGLALLKVTAVPLEGQGASAASAKRPLAKDEALKTPWGDPNLQGIWTDDRDTPVQRPPEYAGREFFTDEEIAALDKTRAAIPRQDHREASGSERDVSGAYNSVFISLQPTGRRTSLIVDPPDGRIPAYTPEAKRRIDVYQEYQLALLQATETCRQQEPACRGGKYGPPSPRRAEVPPVYNTDRLNRADGPEDRSMMERCMMSTLPEFGGFRRIVQSPDAVAIFYDVGQGQGWERIVPVTQSPHVPQNIRRWWGDSRAHWEGKALVVDVTNFTPKLDFGGSRENLHLVERWTRLAADTLEYVVTIEDPTTWVRPWTVKQEMTRQNEEANRIYYEPRCHDTNYGLAGMLANTRAEERDFAAGKGPDPASRDNATGGPGGGQENTDPLGISGF